MNEAIKYITHCIETLKSKEDAVCIGGMLVMARHLDNITYDEYLTLTEKLDIQLEKLLLNCVEVY